MREFFLGRQREVLVFSHKKGGLGAIDAIALWPERGAIPVVVGYGGVGRSQLARGSKPEGMAGQRWVGHSSAQTYSFSPSAHLPKLGTEEIHFGALGLGASGAMPFGSRVPWSLLCPSLFLASRCIVRAVRTFVYMMVFVYLTTIANGPRQS